MYTVVVEWLDQEKSHARFALPGRLEWRAEDVTTLIHLLAEIREQMSPAVSDEPPPLHADALHDPRYSTQLHPFSGGSLLEFRHPSHGWMDFVLPSRERVRITRLLVEQEEAWQRYPR
jgi:hypothetical protein